MPLPSGRDLEQTRARLRDWLATRLPDAHDLQLSELSGPGATGFSSDTLLFDACWREGRAGDEQRLALAARLEPTGPAVFPEYDVAQQFRVQQALTSTGLPLARMRWLECERDWLGTRFYLMERVEGRIPSDNPPYHAGGWMTEIAPDERSAIWWSGLEVLVRIHAVDFRALGLGDLERPEPGDTPLERELAYYRRYLDWAAQGRKRPLLEAAFDWLAHHRPRDESPARLSWGDARIGNMIFRDGRCRAVLDWEMATLAAPELDVAWWLFLDRHHSEGLGLERLPGFPAHEETVARYQQLSGCALRHLDYYEVLAAFRFSAIMLRVAQRMREHGVLPADSTLEDDNIPARLLARLLERPPPGEGSE